MIELPAINFSVNVSLVWELIYRWSPFLCKTNSKGIKIQYKWNILLYINIMKTLPAALTQHLQNPNKRILTSNMIKKILGICLPLALTSEYLKKWFCLDLTHWESFWWYRTFLCLCGSLVHRVPSASMYSFISLWAINKIACNNFR